MLRDCLIIGAGAAGLSAALWCKDVGLDALTLERGREAGGQLLRVYNPIKNYLGAQTQNGRELRDQFLKQVEAARIELRTDAEVSSVDVQAKQVVLQSGETFGARSLILATGVRRRRLNIEGEREFVGRGVLKSGALERGDLAGKRVCVVGGGDAALENALILAEVCESVALVHRGANFTARREFIGRARANPRIKFFMQSQVQRILGDKTVEAVEIRRADGETFILATEGVLIRIGVEPNAELFRSQLRTDARGYIVVTSEQETSAANVFAIGDVANPLAPTISGAVGAGATAAKVIRHRLKN
jgi:thioredoxin reductase (NADPH)